MKTSTRGAPTFGRPLFWNCVCRRRLGSLSSLNHCFNSRLSELSACKVTSEWTRVAVVTRPFLLSRVHRWPHAIINVLLNKPQCIDDTSERNVLLNGLFSNTLVGGHTCLRLKWAECQRVGAFMLHRWSENQKKCFMLFQSKVHLSSVRFNQTEGNFLVLSLA